MYFRLLAFAAPLVLLGGCATAPPTAPLPLAADTPYGMFLAGNAALSQLRNSEASRFLDLARTQGGDEAVVADQAFLAALLAGEIERAALLAPSASASSVSIKWLGRLVQAVEALASGDEEEAYAALTGGRVGFPHRSAAALLKPWAAAAAGDVEASLVRPTARGDQVVEYFGFLNQAFLYERARRYDEAETDFKATTAGRNTSESAILAYGEFLERRGRRKDAIALYDGALARQPGSMAVKIARTRATSGRRARRAPTIREGAAFALLAPAASMISGRQGQIGLAYLRLTLHLDDERNDAWLMVGDILQGAGDLEGARAAYRRPGPKSAEYIEAQVKLAWSYQNAGNGAAALELAHAVAGGGNLEARVALSDIHRDNENYAAAEQILSELITESQVPDSRLYFIHAVTLERLDRWKDAEADLLRAMEQTPEDPELLNYLGYSWIDRGERLEEALRMVRQAVASNPRSGPMVDSLGWAHFRLGDYPSAVRELERAIEFEAGDPEINNHLGDVYWMVGRKDEAVFQWRRVLTLRPDARTKADAEAKLASGAGPQVLTPKLAGQ